MISEKDISKKLERSIKSPIRIGSLSDLKIDPNSFLTFFKPFFESLHNDMYAVKEKQISFLIDHFKEDTNNIKRLYKSYFENTVDINAFKKWTQKFNSFQKEKFKKITTITRQRNISSFVIKVNNNKYDITRVYNDGFEQNVDDFRTWQRVFKQATPECVENELFFELLKKITSLVKTIHVDASKIKITSHFMRSIAQEEIPGENSPEGVHEDGVQYIMSALVINRKNIIGAESQIYEKENTGIKELIYNKVLEPGEFIFQADTGEEITFGNDLWHYVTPINSIEIDKPGIRDIIGFDIDILN